MANVVTRASMADTVPGCVCRISTASLRLCVGRPAGRRTVAEATLPRAEPGVPRHTATGIVAGMSTDARRDLGQAGEQLALEHLERLGYALVARNHRTAHGELDLVVTDGDVLVFVEVKTRRATRATSAGAVPWDALHPGKQRQVRATAAAYLRDAADRPPAVSLRFDAVGVVIDPRGRLVRLDHLEGAF
jgi:putative endonuclease